MSDYDSCETSEDEFKAAPIRTSKLTKQEIELRQQENDLFCQQIEDRLKELESELLMPKTDLKIKIKLDPLSTNAAVLIKKMTLVCCSEMSLVHLSTLISY